MRAGVGSAGMALLAVVCCAGLPLLLAAGLSAAAFAWIGGLALGVVVFVAAVALLIVRARRRAASIARRDAFKKEVDVR